MGPTTKQRATALLILLGLIATSGCLMRPAAQADVAPTQDSTPTPTLAPLRLLSVRADWTGPHAAYDLRFDANPQATVLIHVTDLATGAQETFNASNLTRRSDGTYRVDTAQSPAPGRAYNISATRDDVTLGQRILTAHGDNNLVPADYAGRLEYAIVTSEYLERNEESELAQIHGTSTLDATQSVHRHTVAGRCRLEISDSGFSLILPDLELNAEYEDTNTTAATMNGEGFWWYARDGVHGSGTVQSFLREFQGIEPRANATGATHTSQRWTTQATMRGTITVDGQSVDYEGDMRTLTWIHHETENLVWQSQDITHRYRDPTTGEMLHEQTEHEEGEPVGPDASQASLGDALVTDVLVPTPLVAGDQFHGRGLDDIRILYTTQPGPPVTVNGSTHPTLMVLGTATAGATGTETLYVADGGSLDGILLKAQADYTRGTQTFTARATLLTTS